MRKEKGGDPLNRFLATWEKLHSGAETTPTNIQPMREKQRESQKEKGGGREKGEGGGREKEKERERKKGKETEIESGRGWSEEEDVVEDIELSSDSELSSD